ncbi:MAG TPA: GyrI-like domain-containing protein [Thermoplasmata archaeon]|jgi:DNA gyrase inhibitor GyrI|nr:GyrI-like domain-containing protein [Thermoplasmata archaeon]
MTVDFVLKKVPSLRVASIRWTGPYREAEIRRRFAAVRSWAVAHRLRPGRWVFREPGKREWEVGIEVPGRARSEGGIKVRTLPATRVAAVTFDPEMVAPRVVYHGLSDWVRWRRKEKKVRSVLSTREIYPGDPWNNPRAWSRTEVQFVVRP